MSPLVPIEDLLGRDIAHYRWHPEPQPIAMDHYDAAIAELIDRAQKIPQILAAYDLGPVRFPGLSDIDLLFVVAEDAGQPNLRTLRREALPPKFHDVVLHHPYFIRASELPHVFKFTPILSLRERWTRQPLNGPGDNANPTDLTLTLLDTIAECYPHEFIRFLARDDLDERELVGRLKGLGYCIDLQQKLAGGVGETECVFAAGVDALRRTFFERELPPRRAEILSLTRQAESISGKIALRTAAALTKKWNLQLQGSCLLAATRVPACWMNDPPDPPSAGIVKLRQLDAFGPAPLLYGWLAREYSKGEGPISRHLAPRLIDNLQITGAPSAEIRDAIARRIALRNSHAAWIDQLGQGFYAFNAFGYATREPVGLRKIARDIFEGRRERELRRLLLEYASRPLMAP